VFYLCFFRKRKAKNSATKARKKKTAKEIVETPTRSKVARVQVVDSPARVTRRLGYKRDLASF
jgi:transposase